MWHNVLQMDDKTSYYSTAEEKMSIVSHVVGLGISIGALVLLVTRASLYGTIWHIVSFTIFGIGLVMLFTASILYHSAEKPSLRKKLRIFDHAAIYVLIAATYTPFTLVALHGPIGWTIFGITWVMAVTGIILKLFFTGQYRALSTAIYVVMGWIIIIAIKPLYNNLSAGGLLWLFAGGISYTVGAVIYNVGKIKFSHAVFHLFVVAGAFCHCVAVLYYLLPGTTG